MVLIPMCAPLYEPLIIGHASKPKALNKSSQELGSYYQHNKKAWMTGLLFRGWRQDLDKKCVKTSENFY